MGTDRLDGGVRAATATEAERPWETCEVIREQVKVGFLSTTERFVADAVGPSGRYHAGTSPPFKADINTDFEDPSARSGVKDADAALGSLVSALVRDGWEPLDTRGQYWYSHRLRRQAGPLSLRTAPVAPLQIGSPPTLADRSGGARKSGALAFALWLLLGLIGGHRYYLRRPLTGLLQTLTLGGLGLWWLIDLFLLPGLVRQANDDR